VTVQIIEGYKEHLPIIGKLFQEYAQSLPFPLDFQDFKRELADLPGPYGPPRGAILLARRDEAIVGCIALKPLDATTGEVKRLYVQENHRRQGIGRSLAVAIVERARALGYERLLLDTIADMTPALSLYRSIDFEQRPPYYHNPIPGALFFELRL
jgi:putative acetyltransferase